MRRKYHESLLQWIWKHLVFELRSIQTCCKKPITIEYPGEWNPGAGPDFLNARIQIEDLLWHGHVEIHREENDWYTHSHHMNPDFNEVILHVFLHRGRKKAMRIDGTTPFGFYLTPYLEKPLYQLLQTKHNSDLLPCSGLNQYLSDEVFSRQIHKAHHEYFEYKKEELVRLHPPGPTSSDAWKISFITGLYSALGIPRNREAMITLVQSVYADLPLPNDRDRFIRNILVTADIENKWLWQHTGMRPASRPAKRILQAANLHYEFHQMLIADFLEQDIGIWDRLYNKLKKADRPGKQMNEILYSTVFLPALHLLGELVDSVPLKERSLKAWLSYRADLPKSILRPFQHSGIPLQNNKRHPGLVHQLKRYCQAGHCHRCEVFKMAIRS